MCSTPCVQEYAAGRVTQECSQCAGGSGRNAGGRCSVEGWFMESRSRTQHCSQGGDLSSLFVAFSVTVCVLSVAFSSATSVFSCTSHIIFKKCVQQTLRRQCAQRVCSIHQHVMCTSMCIKPCYGIRVSSVIVSVGSR